MADVDLCRGQSADGKKACPLRFRCERWHAPIARVGQQWIDAKWVRTHNGATCVNFMKRVNSNESQ